jgi:diaminopimelate decarboxylase
MCKLVSDDPLSNSFLIYNGQEARSKMVNWKRLLPWITPYYAIKSNPIRPLLEDVLAHSGCFDCASRGEISTVLKLGAKVSSIIYSNPVKNEKDLKWAEKMGVRYTTADTYDELLKIQKYSPSIRILWRISI